MSGDVQPRKRKDKKKRKDEGDTYGPLSSNEDVTIHLHKDGGTGGNICAKIVFFFLFSALIVLVGLIIKENQGLNELDSAEEESRFSQIFEGWVDKSADEHEDHSPELHSHEESNEDEEEYEDHSEESNIEDSEEVQSQELEQEEDEDSTARSEEDDSHELSSSRRSEDESEVDEDEEDQNSPELSEEKNDSSDETLRDEDDEQEPEQSTEINDNKENSSEEVGETIEGVDAKTEDPDINDLNKDEDTTIPETQDAEQPAKESSGHINVGDELESDSDKDDDEHSDITNKDDVALKEDLDAAQHQLDKNAAYANKMFEALLEQYPLSPRSLYGKARALDILAEKKQSNDLLYEALTFYARVLNAPKVPDRLFIISAERHIDRARFMGQYKKAIAVHWQIIDRFPDNSTYLNNLAVTYLTVNLVEEARSVLKKVISKWPNDGFALVHYGFILKTVDNNLEEAIQYMSKGLRTEAAGVVDGRFYFHLGDALTRVNRKDEADKLYEEGVEKKVFRSKYQRSLYNVDRLPAKPWLNPKDVPSYQTLFAALVENWKQIRQEGLSALNDQGYFQDEAENLKDSGTWKQLELFARGRKFAKNCERTPITCSVIERFPEASRCKRGQTKFSVLHPGTHVWPHCGPTNCRLRIHLGLKIPADVFLRVAEETRGWKEGDIIMFDDSFEHEVWHNGTEFRLVLIVDVWHPNLTSMEKQSLSAI
ncbi:aspartyl/asparaginyl beta-hydroxylase isoform X2 [Dendroctonus ponderosae]|uniref:aspartyl/asparaginyl beta-hydroxylase isoform X2 n=1 Tax=Dendroctonus ponderosae TaxID=77166 RepID=UPI0020354E5C|nr:aspartyl/asparaginyl beta-hydroxylase isoform X2 [Dendroctonus ponderosae]